ncbi:MAG: hypothetical protein WC506_06430 [Candidatus Micrarchaeia archaeon]
MKSVITPPNQKQNSQLKVLDLASWGTAARGYRNSKDTENLVVDIKSVARLQGGEEFGKTKQAWRSLSASKNGGIFPKISIKKVSLQRAEGTVPDCLSSEPKEYYDHVHMHMLPGYGKIGVFEIEPMIESISSIIKDGGLFFFSVNIDFVSKGAIDLLHGANESVFHLTDKIINDRFQVIFRFCDTDMMVENNNQAEIAMLRKKPNIFPITSSTANEIAGSFGLKYGLAADRMSVDEFYSKFSDDAKHVAEYFIIAKSRKDMPKLAVSTTDSVLLPQYQNKSPEFAVD